MIFQSFDSILMCDSEVGNSASLCDVTHGELSIGSVHKFHKNFNLIKTTMSPHLLFKYGRAKMIMHAFLKKLYMSIAWLVS